jgi:hypothetical protein
MLEYPKLYIQVQLILSNMAASLPSSVRKEQLRARFVGKTLNDVPTPSVVLDLAKLEVNCERMLEATERLGLLWRPHIKSHKVTEPTTPFLAYL